MVVFSETKRNAQEYFELGSIVSELLVYQFFWFTFQTVTDRLSAVLLKNFSVATSGLKTARTFQIGLGRKDPDFQLLARRQPAQDPCLVRHMYTPVTRASDLYSTYY